MHVDGFRFDLARRCRAAGPTSTAWPRSSAAIGQDPLLSRLKLIAEPWDVGPHGYQLGGVAAPVGRVERPLPRRGPPLLARRPSAWPASWATA